MTLITLIARRVEPEEEDGPEDEKAENPPSPLAGLIGPSDPSSDEDSSEDEAPPQRPVRASRFQGSYNEEDVRINLPYVHGGPVQPVAFSTWGDLELLNVQHDTEVEDHPEEPDGRPVVNPDMPPLEPGDEIYFVPALNQSESTAVERRSTCRELSYF